MLLGDTFGLLKRPYFLIADNYLVLCNSLAGINGFYKNYTSGNFLMKNNQYLHFDSYNSERANVSLFINFKGMLPIIKKSLKPAFKNSFDDYSAWPNFYGASLQLTAAGKDFYTSIFMPLAQPDTSQVN